MKSESNFDKPSITSEDSHLKIIILNFTFAEFENEFLAEEFAFEETASKSQL